MTGKVLGHYTVGERLGAGGMGEVYRARDTRLNRDVALKVLPEVFARDAERMARFEREAQVLASLNHPNIAAIYGLEESGGTRAIVMELVEGATLSGPLPLADAVPIARQIAEALEYAHERGIIHRDLKPANVKVTPEGQVKLLDFGLAKALDDGPAEGSMRNSPTLSMAATRAGVILGTAAYMSPEQAKGKPVDRRADIWSFGVVLYELLTRRQLYHGDSVAEILASVMMKEPALEALPAPVRGLVGRCLEKDPRQRLRDIGEARIALDRPVAPVAPSPPAPPRWWIVATVLFLLASIGFAVAWFRRPAAEAPAMRFSVSAPEKTSFVDVLAPLISPDGRRLAFATRAADGRRLLWVRPLDSLTAQPLAGTDGANFPFWSADSRFLGFFAQDKLKKIEISGGPPQTLCDARQGGGGAWNRDGVILFAIRGQPLHRVSAAGGPPTAVTAFDTARDFGHRFPEFLPDGRHFLYYRPARQGSNVHAGSLDAQPGAGASKPLLGADSAALYAPSSQDPAKGHLLFQRESTLMAQPFDAGRLKLAGDPFPVAEQVGVNILGGGTFSVSANGVLAYTTGAGGNRQLAWFDRAGKPLGVVGAPALYHEVSLSPDQSRAAVVIGDQRELRFGDIWVVDLARNISSRFTFAPGLESLPVWAPDSGRILFTGVDAAVVRSYQLYQKVASGAGNEEEVPVPKGQVYSQDWSSDGRYLLYCTRDPKTQFDLWVLPLTGDRKPVPYLQTPFSESYGQFSPDVRWIAYASNESGVQQVYVQPFPAAGGKWQITSGGGSQPRWRRDGKEIFYIAPDRKLMAVSVKAGPGGVPAFGLPQELFQTRVASGSTNLVFLYAAAADGQRFLINTALEETASTPITVVLNWTAGVKR